MRYDYLPEHMQEGARLYVERGVEPGGFLLALLCNDFAAAVGRADSDNKERLADWAVWLYNDAPRASWGSLDAVNAWIEHSGLEGLK